MIICITSFELKCLIWTEDQLDTTAKENGKPTSNQKTKELHLILSNSRNRVLEIRVPRDLNAADHTAAICRSYYGRDRHEKSLSQGGTAPMGNPS
jgi:hypothetical protein